MSPRGVRSPPDGATCPPRSVACEVCGREAVVLCFTDAPTGGPPRRPEDVRVWLACYRHQAIYPLGLEDLARRGLAWWLAHLRGKHWRGDLALGCWLEEGES